MPQSVTWAIWVVVLVSSYESAKGICANTHTPVPLSRSRWGITKLGSKDGVGPTIVCAVRTWYKRWVQTDAPVLPAQNMFLSNKMDHRHGCSVRSFQMGPPGYSSGSGGSPRWIIVQNRVPWRSTCSRDLFDRRTVRRRAGTCRAG